MRRFIETKRTCPICKQGTVQITNRKSSPQIEEDHDTLTIRFDFEATCTNRNCEYDHVGFTERVFQK